MRIAFIVGQFPMLSETFVLNQITGLIDRGHEVDIYTESWGDRVKIHPDVQRYQLLNRTYLLHNVPQNLVWRLIKGAGLFFQHVWRSPKFVLRSLNVGQYGLLSAGLWLLYSSFSLYDKAPYDIVHCQFGTQGYTGVFFQQLLQPQPKLIVMFRGFDISGYVQQQGSTVYDELFRQADCILTNCEFFRKKVIDLGCPSDRVSVHLSGLDCHKFQFVSRHFDPGDEIRIATTGRLLEKKGIEYAIRAVAQKIKDYPNLRYQIIGDGPLRESLQALIRELDAENNIQLLGWRNEQEIISVLSKSHLFIAPSVTARDGNQDAPINVLKEAMAMGLPVISTHHGGIPELVQHGISGYLVPERDANALADKIEILIQQSERWPEMGLAGRQFVEQNYSIHELNNRLVKVYDQLTKKQGMTAEFKPFEMEATPVYKA